MFKPTDWFDRVFEIGIVGKGINGAAEFIGGLLLLFLTPDRIHHWAVVFTQSELSDDPHDVVANYILHTANGLTGHAVLYGAIYLLSHGIVKLGLVIALLMNKLWAYPAMIAVLLGFIGYQSYRIALDVTVGMVLLTVFDVLIVFLTVREYGRQRKLRRERRSSGGGAKAPSGRTATRGPEDEPAAAKG